MPGTIVPGTALRATPLHEIKRFTRQTLVPGTIVPGTFVPGTKVSVLPFTKPLSPSILYSYVLMAGPTKTHRRALAHGRHD